MEDSNAALDAIARQMSAELQRLDTERPVSSEASNAAVWQASVRELFYELFALGLANLFNKTPLPSALFDRGMITAVLGHLGDVETGRIADRAEEWVRAEGLVRIQEGQKNSYTLTVRALALLSVETNGLSVGQWLEQALAHYARKAHTPELRQATRRIAGNIIAQMGSR